MPERLETLVAPLLALHPGPIDILEVQELDRAEREARVTIEHRDAVDVDLTSVVSAAVVDEADRYCRLGNPDAIAAREVVDPFGSDHCSGRSREHIGPVRRVEYVRAERLVGVDGKDEPRARDLTRRLKDESMTLTVVEFCA